MMAKQTALVSKTGQPARNWWHRVFPRAKTENDTVWTPFWMVGEALLFIGLALWFSYWLVPSDPFNVHAAFPWLWIVPAVLAMRYGSGIGVVAVLIVLLSWLTFQRYAVAGAPQVALPQGYFLGGLMLTLICGQFAEVGNVRGRRLRAINAYLDERLTTLTKNHFLLRLSHERLEQDLLSKPLTLRESLDRMRALTLNQRVGAHNPLPAADQFIQILVQSCQLEIASIHVCEASDLVSRTPLAVLGAPSELVLDDPLLLHCLEQQKLAHVQSAGLSQPTRTQSRYMICAPLKNFDDVIFGVLVVEKLPFVALNDDMLQLLSVLIDYYADGIQMSTTSHRMLQSMPDCPPDLATEVVRLHRLKVNADIDSALVALVFGSDQNARDMCEQIKRLKRAVDVVWNFSDGSRNVLITLLPLAGTAAVEGYLMRIESMMQAQFGSKFLSNYAQVHSAYMGPDAPALMLSELVQRCAV